MSAQGLGGLDRRKTYATNYCEGSTTTNVQYQKSDAACAAASLQNCLRILGIRVGQHKLFDLLRGDSDGKDGADEQDVLRVLSEYGGAVSVLETCRRRDAELWLAEFAHVSPIMICVDNWEHWVSIGGGCKDRLWLFDPSPSPWNTAENGSWALLPKTILRRWKAARAQTGDGGLYYGIAILSADTRTHPIRRSAAQ